MSIGFVRKFVASMFMLAVLFPWVSFRMNSMDTQPWAFLLSVLFILLCLNIKFNKNVLCVFLLPFFASFLFFGGVDKDLNLSLRGFFSYLFFAFVYLGSYFYIKNYSFPVNIVFISNYLYLLIGVVQVVFGDKVVEFIAPIRTTESRGVTSLAVEPTNFGLVLLLFSWFYLIFSNYKLVGWFKVTFFVNLIAILFLAQSSMVMCFIVLGMIFVFIYKVKVFYIFFYFLFFYFLSGLFLHYFSESRISQLFVSFNDLGVLELIVKDASLNFRVSSFVFPYRGFLENGFMPGGFVSFNSIASVFMQESGGFFWYGEHVKIMSFTGALVYELGLVGIFFVFLYLIFIQNGSYRRFLESVFLFLLLNTAIPIASPLIALLLCSLVQARGDVLFLQRSNRCAK